MKVRKATNRIFWHCTATPPGREVTYDDLWAWHVLDPSRNYNHIGYHHLVQLDGTVVKCRPENLQGAHVMGHNEDSVGIVYAGGVDHSGAAKDTRTPAQITSMYKLTDDLLAKYNLDWDDVYGHNEVAARACPSFNVSADINMRLPDLEFGETEPNDPELGAIGHVVADLVGRIEALEEWAKKGGDL